LDDNSFHAFAMVLAQVAVAAASFSTAWGLACHSKPNGSGESRRAGHQLPPGKMKHHQSPFACIEAADFVESAHPVASVIVLILRP
jgi:hypothetical protein